MRKFRTAPPIHRPHITILFSFSCSRILPHLQPRNHDCVFGIGFVARELPAAFVEGCFEDFGEVGRREVGEAGAGEHQRGGGGCVGGEDADVSCGLGLLVDG